MRRVELYDLVKLNNVLIPLTTPSFIGSSENEAVGVASRCGRTKPITKRGNVHCEWFKVHPLLLLRDSHNLVFTRS